MANTFTFVPDDVPNVEGRNRTETGVLSWTGTYVTGGDQIPVATSGTPTLFRLARLDGIEFLDQCTSLGQVITYTPATRRLKFWQGAAGNFTELANGGTNAGSVRIKAYGLGL